MIRPFTLITMLLAAGSGAYMFAVKHHAQILDDQIADISQGTRLDAQRIIVLQAQWALETRPTRLQQLASQFTDLQPMQPAQLITLAALKTSLPAPGSAQPGANPELPGDPQPILDASAAPPALDAAGDLPLPPPQAPAGPHPAGPHAVAVMLAASAPLASPAPKMSAIRPARRVSHSTLAGALADALPPPRPYPSPRLFAPAPAAPDDRSVPAGAQVVPVKASGPMPQYYPAIPPMTSDNSGSALGMAAELPPPQPLPQNGLNN